MVIFHSYVSLPEGTTNILGEIESGKEREKNTENHELSQ